MKKQFLLALCIIFCIHSFAQDFPKSFIGNWQGELLWYKKDSKTPQKIKMQLEILPTDTANQFSWLLIYGEKKEDSRPYVLKPVDTAKGHWVIDEKNGIVLDQYWLGNKLSGAFTVLNSTIINTYYLIKKNKMVVEFYNISAKSISTTGGTSNDIPAVNSYEVKTLQKAILKRSKK